MLFRSPRIKSSAPVRPVIRNTPVIVSAIPVSVAESDFSDLDSSSEQNAKMPESEITVQADDSPSVEPVVEPFADSEAPAVVILEKPVTKPIAATTAFVEPKPQQTGYVPVAPPSFSMPSSANSGFDFTVRISPENKVD